MIDESLKKYKLLVVEDDTYLADIYATKLRLEGFDAEVANDGETGIEVAKKIIPNVMLLDIMLPGMDGFEVLKAIKSDPTTQNCIVIMLTNLDSSDDVRKGVELGAADYMVKAHFVPAEIVSKVKGILELLEEGQAESSPDDAFENFEKAEKVITPEEGQQSDVSEQEEQPAVQDAPSVETTPTGQSEQ